MWVILLQPNKWLRAGMEIRILIFGATIFFQPAFQYICYNIPWSRNAPWEGAMDAIAPRNRYLFYDHPLCSSAVVVKVVARRATVHIRGDMATPKNPIGLLSQNCCALWQNSTQKSKVNAHHVHRLENTQMYNISQYDNHTYLSYI